MLAGYHAYFHRLTCFISQQTSSCQIEIKPRFHYLGQTTPNVFLGGTKQYVDQNLMFTPDMLPSDILRPNQSISTSFFLFPTAAYNNASLYAKCRHQLPILTYFSEASNATHIPSKSFKKWCFSRIQAII